jgi:hypothetical protein
MQQIGTFAGLPVYEGDRSKSYAIAVPMSPDDHEGIRLLL